MHDRSNRKHRLLLILLLVALVAGMWFFSTRMTIDRRNIDRPTSAVEQSQPPMTPQQAFERLQLNTPVDRAVRLIVYDPATQPQLAIGRLETLGPPRQEFVFVADYRELRGHTVAKAINMVGQQCPAGSRVSAIIFPVQRSEIVPAGARGMLQTIQDLDRRHEGGQAADGVSYRPAELSRYLSPEAIAALNDRSQQAGAWKNYRRHFESYRSAVERLLQVDPADRISAFEYIGSIDSDWSPLGYAQFRGRSDPPTPTQYLTLGEADGEPAGENRIAVPDFGARVFLTPNRKLTELQGQWLIDFDRPDRQRLPEVD